MHHGAAAPGPFAHHRTIPSEASQTTHTAHPDARTTPTFTEDPHVTALHCSQQSLADCVRHDLVAACDAFGHSDFVLCSAVGGFAGQVYEKYLAAIRGAPGFAGPQQHPAWGETFGAVVSSSAMQAKPERGGQACCVG